MSKHNRHAMARRTFLGGALAAGTAAFTTAPAYGADGRPLLEAGQAEVDATPPLGIEMAGFHRAPRNERRIAGIRQPTAARALVLRYQDQQAAIVSLDLIGLPLDFTQRVQRAVAEKVGIPAANVRICATHSHSTPTFLTLRQWGAVPPAYMAAVEEKVVEAIQRAWLDLAPAEVFVGQERAKGGNFNRTGRPFRTDSEFDAKSTDGERWVDTTLHVLRFERGRDRKALLWYHFSAHPVCYGDDLAGPDWPGIVATRSLEEDNLLPVFLQGHCGDVNPGDGEPWIGDPKKTSDAVYQALRQALNNAKPVRVDGLRWVATEFRAPFDMARFKSEIDRYQREPEKCTAGEWVDAAFASDWAAWAARWDAGQTNRDTPLSALALGDVGLLFHSSELYSYYGLAIRRDSPFEHTVVVGYADDQIGYVTDPTAYQAGEYAAAVVPKIISLPPFTPQTGQQLTAAANHLLRTARG